MQPATQEVTFCIDASDLGTQIIGILNLVNFVIFVLFISVGRPKHVRVMAGALEGDIFIGPKAEVC